MIQWEIKIPHRKGKSLLIRFCQPQTHRESFCVIVAPEWFVLRLFRLESTRTRGKVTSDLCVHVCVCENVCVSPSDSVHVSAIYWNIAGTSLRPRVFNGYLRASVGSLAFSFFPLTKVLCKTWFIFVSLKSSFAHLRTEAHCWPKVTHAAANKTRLDFFFFWSTSENGTAFQKFSELTKLTE